MTFDILRWSDWLKTGVSVPSQPLFQWALMVMPLPCLYQSLQVLQNHSFKCLILQPPLSTCPATASSWNPKSDDPSATLALKIYSYYYLSVKFHGSHYYLLFACILTPAPALEDSYSFAKTPPVVKSNDLVTLPSGRKTQTCQTLEFQWLEIPGEL